MNILFIGPYRQDDEWGRKSRSLLKTLHRPDHKVTSRPLFLSTSPSYNAYAEPAEFVTCKEYDVLIQFSLQPLVTYAGNFSKRVGVFNSETIPYDIPLGNLTKELLMDEVWTDSPLIQQRTQNIINDYGYDTTVKAIPPFLDTTHLPPSNTNHIKLSDPTLKDKFIFYYIGNITEDKDGLKEAVIAYLNTFTNVDPVGLIIMPETQSDPAVLNSLLEECHACIGERHHPTQRAMIKALMEEASLEKRLALHMEGDCMICPSYSIATNSLVLEGALYGSCPIINKGNACYEWWGEEHFWGIESFEEVCVDKNRPLPYRFTSGETWHSPIIKSLEKTMKAAYVDKFKRDKKIAANAKLFDYFKNTSLEI